MGVRCSHVMLRVQDLHQAVRDYRELGFVVDYASPERKALHAHVWFPREPIIELVVAPRFAKYYRLPATLAFGRCGAERMLRWTRADEGFCDAAAVTDTTAEFPVVLQRLRKLGVPFGKPITWKRTPPGGPETRFQFAYPENVRLPFLVSPYEPPLHPVEACHANGATGITTVTVGVRPEDRSAFDLIVDDDPVFRVEGADVTEIRSVDIAGLASELDSACLHGAVIRAATGSARDVET